MRLKAHVDLRQLSSPFARSLSDFDTAVAALPGIRHWFDAGSDYVVNYTASELHWYDRVGRARLTSILSGTGAITKTTGINSQDTLTVNGNGIMYGLRGAFPRMPEGDWSLIFIGEVDDTATRHIVGNVPASVTESDPHGLWVAVSAGYPRRYSPDATTQARSTTAVITAAQPFVAMWTWSTTRGPGFFVDSATQLGTTFQSGSAFANLGKREFKVFQNESSGSTSRFLGKAAQLIVAGYDYSRPSFATVRSNFFSAAGTRYNISIT